MDPNNFGKKLLKRNKCTKRTPKTTSNVFRAFCHYVGNSVNFQIQKYLIDLNVVLTYINSNYLLQMVMAGKI